jgi:glycosyltransferase involved in cell wall biosynthesis
MRILEVLTYYRPHISGLTIYVERLSKALANQGHEVTVFTSQYDRDLPLSEEQDGLAIRRVPVAMRVSKGVIMPRFGPQAWGMVRQADIIHLHLPQFDAPGVAMRGRLYGKPVVLTYHSDLQLPPGLFNRFVDRVVHSLNRVAGSLADAVVTYTHDFGSHSPFLSPYMGRKLHVIPPPVELAPATSEETRAFRAQHGLDGRPVIGISARLAAEKGIEVLLDALPAILARFPDALVLHASPGAIGEDAYVAHITPLLQKFRANYRLLGPLHGSELTAFYRNLDCLVMCSLNNTETFGLVQVEAMMCGVPAVASDLPGVRQPVRMTGMGEIAPVGDSAGLAAAIIKVLASPASYHCPPELIADSFAPASTAEEYVRLFSDLLQGNRVQSPLEPSAYQRLRRSSEGSSTPGAPRPSTP